MSQRSWIASFATALSLIGAAGSMARIHAHEARERDVHREGSLRELGRLDGSTSESARLAGLTLTRGDLVVFELCSEDGLPAPWERTVDLVVWETGSERVLVRETLDAETLAEARRSEHGACLTVGRGVVPGSGTYAFDAIYLDAERVADVPLRARGIARWPIELADMLFVLLAFAGAAAWIGLVFAGRPPIEDGPDITRKSAATRLAVAIVLALVTAEALRFSAALYDVGAVGALVRGLVFASIEVALAWFLIAPGLAPREALGLTRPRISVGKALVAFAVTAATLSVIANLATRFVPSTGTAPIETFVSQPSGILSFATLAAIAPFAEELFFRGFIYGTALRFGRVAAFLSASLLFGLAHAPQAWGSWGGLAAVVAAGLGLTALRAWSGSIAVPLAAHLLYNAALAWGGLR